MRSAATASICEVGNRQYLDKARQALKEARATAGIELAEAAGRAAYLAVFHAVGRDLGVRYVLKGRSPAVSTQ